MQLHNCQNGQMILVLCLALTNNYQLSMVVMPLFLLFRMVNWKPLRNKILCTVVLSAGVLVDMGSWIIKQLKTPLWIHIILTLIVVLMMVVMCYLTTDSEELDRYRDWRMKWCPILYLMLLSFIS